RSSLTQHQTIGSRRREILSRSIAARTQGCAMNRMPIDITDPRVAAYATPLEDFDVSRARLFQADAQGPFFERLRHEDPVHYCRQSSGGPYWSITKYNDIRQIDSDHQSFSS